MNCKLPQLEGGWFLTDGGIETSLIYDDGLELPEFASFVLLDDVKGRAALARYFRRYLDIAAGANGAGFILESPTWRASPGWGAKIGYDADSIRRINGEAIALMRELGDEYKARIGGAIVISGCVGPRGDGYIAGQPMSGDDAMRYHLPQARALADAGAQMITAITICRSSMCSVAAAAQTSAIWRRSARLGKSSAHDRGSQLRHAARPRIEKLAARLPHGQSGRLRAPAQARRCTEINHYDPFIPRRSQMPKPNYAFAKRQRDIAKKQKKEEKRQRKTGGSDNPSQERPPQPPGDENTVA